VLAVAQNRDRITPDYCRDWYSSASAVMTVILYIQYDIMSDLYHVKSWFIHQDLFSQDDLPSSSKKNRSFPIDHRRWPCLSALNQLSYHPRNLVVAPRRHCFCHRPDGAQRIRRVASTAVRFLEPVSIAYPLRKSWTCR